MTAFLAVSLLLAPVAALPGLPSGCEPDTMAGEHHDCCGSTPEAVVQMHGCGTDDADKASCCDDKASLTSDDADPCCDPTECPCCLVKASTVVLGPLSRVTAAIFDPMMAFHRLPTQSQIVADWVPSLLRPPIA